MGFVIAVLFLKKYKVKITNKSFKYIGWANVNRFKRINYTKLFNFNICMDLSIIQVLLQPKEVLLLKGAPDEVHCKCRYSIVIKNKRTALLN